MIKIRKRVVFLVLMALSVCAQATELRVTPFQAEYRIETRYALIPDVRVQQRIEPIVNGYRASMKASLPMLSWAEHSLFKQEHEALMPLQFLTRHQILHAKKQRTLDGGTLSELALDRQTAVIALAYSAMNLPKGSQGVLPTLNDKGEDRSLGYQITRKGLLRGQPVAVLRVWLEHKPEEEAEVFLALDVPGLIIQAKVFENGIQQGALRLRNWKLI